MRRIGLTGGIGCGKSEVSRRFAALGAVVVDADLLAREVVAAGTPGLAAVVTELGEQVLAPDGSMDRERVGRLVFADSAARQRLNAIVHPLVGQATARAFAAAPPDALVVHDVPLLVEVGLAASYDAVVVVASSTENQLDRLVRLRGMSLADARSRIEAQAPLAEKVALADHVICNDADLAALDARVREVWGQLVAGG